MGTAGIVGLLLSACSNPVEEATTTRGREIIPEAAEGIVLARQESGSMSIQGEDEETGPRIELEAGTLFISAVDVNLDIDEPEEQIVVIKRADDSEDRVRLLVTDFDPLRSTYRVTWEGVTRASNVRTFAVYTMDVVGDHQDEIVAVGTDGSGRQTMNVFRRRMDDDDGTTLSYREIFAAASDGSIEIDEVTRSDAYRTLQSDGASFPIQVYRRNTDTETRSDLILTDWQWRPEDGRYEAERTVPIPAMQAQEEQLREMYDADAETLEDFLAGPWFRSSGEEIGSSVEFALFDPTAREVVLYRNNSQEQYQWLNSYKTLYADGPGLWMNLRNNVLATVRRQLSITVEDLDTVSISVEGAEYWNGRYERMTPGIQSGIVQDLSIGKPDFELSGVYSNENGVELLFDQPQFRFRTRDFDWSGGYNLIQLDQPVLELKVTESDLVPSTAQQREDGSFSVRYTVEYTENASDGRVLRRLTLNPVQITADGARRTGGVALIMEQVEDEQDEQDEEDSPE
ncbi:MAG: pallilysin-related adhesin [Alkalispirochaeta sp.]